ncbi:hypothetical protein PWT90_04976 [Aphanocladium album]|nr:hypothetical protein PWT90_04976 [Aphanocladium album]
MANHNINLNDDEMWDDSALVNSWNEALDEYKKYHSIHAKGGSIKELHALSASKYVSVETTSPELSLTGHRKAATAEVVPDSDDVTMEADQASSQGNQNSKTEATAHEAANAVPAISPPQAVLGTVKDENLKKLLMSWYYAGYYTGLYEGQQQQQQQPQ